MKLALLCASLALPLVAHADKIVLVAGGPQDAVGIPAVYAKLKEPYGTGFDASGNLWFIESGSGNRLLKVDADGMLTHIAGQPKPGASGDGDPALQAQFNGPHSLAVLPNADVLIADTWNGCVRKVAVKTGIVSQLPGFQVPAETARASGPYCITLDFTGTKLYIADLKRIHVVDLATDQSQVVAGNGKKGRPEDGALATDALWPRIAGAMSISSNAAAMRCGWWTKRAASAPS